MAVKEFIQDINGNVTVEKDTGEVAGFNVAETLIVTEAGITKGGSALTAGELSALTTAVGGGGGGGGVTDGSKVDVTVAGSTWTINNDVVTNAKAANMANSTIKGRSTAGSGDPEDLTPSQVRTMLNVASGATANSPDATLLNRTNHTGTQAASTISDFAAAARAQTEAELVAGTNITITPGSTGATRTLTIAASGGSGSVTSVGMTVPTGLSVANSPITTTGTLAVTLAAGYEIPTRAELNTFLTEDLATDITDTKTSIAGADKMILLDSAASDAPKLFTAATLRKMPVGSSLGTTGTVNLDFAALVGTVQTITMTGNITFTASNYEAGIWYELVLDANGASRTLAYPATWKAYGAALPTSLASGKTLSIAFRSRGTTEGAVDVTSALSV